MTCKILSCDGGGIRGLITALLIQDLEGRYGGFIKEADGFAGTSTGGLIALGLSRDTAIGDIVEIYRTKGAEIFTPNGWLLATAEQKDLTEEKVLAGPGMRVCQYKSDGLKALAEKLLGDVSLSASEKLVAVNAVQLWDEEMESWQPRTLSSLPGNPYSAVRMVDAALATAAAPTYFPPHKLPGDLGYFADGGLFANNPAMTAASEALGGGLADRLADLRVLSLGTGQDPQGIRPSNFNKYKPLDWGTSKWLWPLQWGDDVPATALLSLLFSATSSSATAQADQLIRAGFCRANVPLPVQYGLDDYKQVAKLEDWTKSYIQYSEEWENTRRWVEKNWS